MAIICRSYNLLFIMTPRTGCTAIGRLLCDQFGGEFLPKTDIIDSQGFIRVQKKHNTIDELLENDLLTANQTESLFKFCSVRNPFDSLVSLYSKKTFKYQPLLSDPFSWVNRVPGYSKDMAFCRNHSFNEWITKTCLKKCIKRVLGLKSSMFNQYTKGVDAVMRFENLSTDFQNVFKRIGISFESTIPMVNRTTERSDSDYRSYYSILSRTLVEFVYYHDLKTYGYRF